MMSATSARDGLIEEMLLKDDPHYQRLFSAWASAKSTAKRAAARAAVEVYKERKFEAYRTTHPGLYDALMRERHAIDRRRVR